MWPSKKGLVGIGRRGFFHRARISPKLPIIMGNGRASSEFGWSHCDGKDGNGLGVMDVKFGNGKRAEGWCMGVDAGNTTTQQMPKRTCNITVVVW